MVSKNSRLVAVLTGIGGMSSLSLSGGSHASPRRSDVPKSIRLNVPRVCVGLGPRRCLRPVAASAAGVEAVQGVDPSLTPVIQAALDKCLTETDLPIKGKHYVVSLIERVGCLLEEMSSCEPRFFLLALAGQGSRHV